MPTTTYSANIVVAGAEPLRTSNLGVEGSGPALAALADGNWFGAWEIPGSVDGRWFNSSGGGMTNDLNFINTTTPGNQFDVDAAGLTGGRLATTFTDDSSGTALIRARLFNANLSSVGNDFIVSDTGNWSGAQTDAEVAALTNGNFVAAWVDEDGASAHNIVFKILDASGAQVFAPGTAISGANDLNPTVVGLTGGGFVIVWERHAGANTELWYRVFNASGSPVTVAIQHDTGGSVNANAQVAARPDGGFVIAYEDNGWFAGASGVEITLARFSPGGVFQGEIAASGGMAGNDIAPAVTVLDNGFIALNYIQDNADPLLRVGPLRIYDSALNLQFSSTPWTAQNSGSAFASLASGRFAMAYDSVANNSLSYGVFEIMRTIVGDGTAEVILGDSLRDIVTSGGGNDTIRTYGGGDFIYFTGTGGANMIATSGDGNDEIDAMSSTGGHLVAEGGSGDDSMTAATSSTTVEFYGDDGADTLGGGAGSDYLSGGSGSDLIQATGGGLDRVIGGAGADDLLGDSGDIFFGGDGADLIRINSTAGLTNGYVDAGADADQVLVMDFGGNSIFVVAEGGDGNDVLEVFLPSQGATVEFYGQQGTDTLRGGKGNDWLSGGTENDTLFGGAGNDRIIGGDGADFLYGEAGDDYLYGGAGADQFNFTTSVFSGQVDTIRDYEDGVDVIYLPASIANAGNTTITQSAFGLYLSVAGANWGVLIEVPWATQINIGTDVQFI